ncbi:MAG TPA: nuclear transport factor 2 family protein [Anaerolineaceae bacterium]|jgi:hypothetical protein|nr:nuclear transport factor 2 family protein [Anaerolineaceae bacterium]HPD62520.1 nuclear transport factor 2 family protein [Anaerolineaceae bacterium]HQM54173.1 nuclear transport factor 2 family protein [Anaerolineaceae bacterium]HRS73354.1 nuclear transport factor 2 family protein [Anaerolineaceae bacterium]HRT90888.1 nuclear transport factor 2 family protein [Anaerolineaceae bacterium]
MTLTGKGMMIWKIPSCEAGNPSAIARVAASSGFSHVLIKIANDTRPYNVDSSGRDLIPPVVDALRAKGIQVWGWHYVYGYDPVGEANIAVSQTRKYALDGYVIDAEVEYKQAGREAVAKIFMTQLRKGIPSTPVALSSFRWPTYHRSFPYSAFLEKCDLNMPQVYWMQAHNPDYDLKRSVNEFKAISPFRPIVPTGPAYGESGWYPSPSEVKLFLDTARSLGLTAANFYSWDYSRVHLVPVWDEIARYSWPAQGSVPPPSSDPVTRLFDALNAMQYDPMLEIYAPNAVLVTPQQTIQGNANIRGFFGQMLTNQLNDGDFRVTSKEVKDNVIHYTWTCHSRRGIVNNGKDTVGLKDGRVLYHYCYYSIE